jgi:hypothetical protein
MISPVRIIIAVLMLVIFLISCSRRENEVEKKDIIPQGKLTDIITDLYLTDGLLMIPLVQQWYEAKDSVSAYNDVLSSHGYTKEDFDRTIRFYFIKKPKNLMKIYEQSLARLSEMESRYAQEVARIDAKLSNLWTGKERYSSGGPIPSDSTAFDVKLKITATYKLKFTATVFPGDETAMHKPVIYACHPDSATDGKRKYVKTFSYLKDGLPHEYVYQINPDISKLRLMGNFFDPGNNPNAAKHFIIEDISLTY